MSRKRSTFEDDTLIDSTLRALIPRLDARRGAMLLFLLWAVALVLSAQINYNKGHTYAVKHIADAIDYHKECMNSDIIRRKHPQECLQALIDKDLSVDDTAKEYMFATTNMCIVVGCYAEIVKFVDHFGWLLIGLAALVASIGGVAWRFSAAAQPTHTTNTTYLCNNDEDASSFAGAGNVRRRGELRLLTGPNE